MAGLKEVIPEANRWILITSCHSIFRNVQEKKNDAPGSPTSLRHINNGFPFQLYSFNMLQSYTKM